MSSSARILCVVAVALIVGLTLPHGARPQQAPLDEAKSLKSRSVELYGAGKASEAIPLAERALLLREAGLPTGHPAIAESLNDLAALYTAQGRYGEAEPLFKRALALNEAAFPAGHPDIAQTLNKLGLLFWAQWRLKEGEQLAKRALALTEAALPAGHPDIAQSLNTLGLLYWFQFRLNEAEPILKRALAMRESALPAGHLDIATSVNDLAALYQAQGRHDEAESLFKRALAVREAALPAGHPYIAQSLNNLALLYWAQARLNEAEPLAKRALAMRNAALPKGHPDIAQNLNDLAFLYQAQGRLREAEPLFKEALTMREAALRSGHPYIAQSLNNLGMLYQRLGRLDEAEPLYRRALAIREEELPAGHPVIATTVNNLGLLYQAQGRLRDAEPLLERALALTEAALPAGHPYVVQSLNNLAFPYFVEGDWDRAADYWRRGTTLLVGRARRDAAALGAALSGKSKGEMQQNEWQFIGLVKALYRVVPAGRTGDRADETFLAAQWARGSEAAGALAEAAARSGAGNNELGKLARERQDAVGLWRTLEAQMIAAHGSGAPKAELAARIKTIEERVAEVDATLQARFPEYASLASPEPLSIAGVQAQLGTDEALVLIVNTPGWKPTPEETFLWVVTKTDARWVRAELGTSALGEHVAALRCGLDASELADPSTWSIETDVHKTRKDEQQARRDRCRTLLKTDYIPGTITGPLPYDLARAHTLYKALFSEVADLIEDKHLLIVPSGPLQSLPFHALITAMPPGIEAGPTSKHVARLGAELRTLTDHQRQGLSLESGQGVAVVHVVPGSAAANTGILAGDVLLAVDGDAVGSSQQGVDAVRARRPGAKVTLRLVREGKPASLDVVLGSVTVSEWIPFFLEPKAPDGLRWLVQSNAITILPSVASLKALRTAWKKGAPAPEPYIGIGDPALEGGSDCPQAPQFAACPGDAVAEGKPPAGGGLVKTTVAWAAERVEKLSRRGLADVDAIRKQCPLPETVDEMRCVAKSLGAPPERVVTRDAATETTVKKTDLSRYRVLHFATHGILAGEAEAILNAGAEPGLILTPPAVASPDNDGLLTASEIIGLKLNADWVILSACNTAAGDKGGADQLSGLARAFFYAGARALLVSHWYVNSEASVKLVSRAFAEMKTDHKIGRAEAMRRAMRYLIEKDVPYAAHPAYWAPFIVVGEGAR